MFRCEECNYAWEEKQRYVGDPETTHCPECGSAEIGEIKPQNCDSIDERRYFSIVSDLMIGDWPKDERRAMMYCRANI